MIYGNLVDIIEIYAETFMSVGNFEIIVGFGVSIFSMVIRRFVEP